MRRYWYMKLAGIILIMGCAGLLCLSNTGQPGNARPGPRRDTLKRPLPPHRKTAAAPVRKKPQAVAEEDRNIHITSTVLSITVRKSLNKMYVYFGDTFKVYRVALGASPEGHKSMRGDNRTPEGRYYISFKNPNSRGYKSLKISYPNEADISHARKIGVDPGGDIFIHGLWWPQQNPATHWKDNWTWGCIALNNEQIDELYRYTELNTAINILP